VNRNMALFNRNPFKRIEKSQHIQSSLVPQSFTQYDSEYIEYCIAQEQSVSNLETGLHTTDDPKEIAMQTLRTACDFYAADWAGIVELDLELGVASPGWWYNPDPKVTSIQKMYEQEDFFSMKTWISSFKHGNPIVISDISEIIKRSPQEYQVYKRLNVRSIMAVPFSSTPNGFLVIRNPSRYNNRTSTLIALAYLQRS